MHGEAATAPLRFIPGTIYSAVRRTTESRRQLRQEATIISRDRCSRDFITIMTNQERIQARIARSKARKAEKRKELIAQCGDFRSVITNQNLLRSLQKRRKETEWKGSVQTYISHAIVKNKRAKDALLQGRLNVNQSIKHLIINERGKRRDCHAIMIDARVIQGVICDSSITPLTKPSLIYDNPASTKGKGVDFARRRMSRHLRRQVVETGPDFYVLVYDFSGYFDSIRHSLCREKLRKAGQDEMLERLTMYFIKMYQAQDISLITDPEERQRQTEELQNDEATGATLGSQISQDMALVIPNELDHAIKDKNGIKHYQRYMDDGNATGTKETLRKLYKEIAEICDRLGLRLNKKKTHIVRARRGFTFLKIRYTVTETGRILKQIAKSSIVRQRRKLKKFRKKVDQGLMSLQDAFNSFMSWYGTVKKVARTYRQRKRMLNLYNSLFHQFRTGGMIA